MSNATLKAESRARRTQSELVSRRYVVNQQLLLISLAVFAVIMLGGYFWYQSQLGKTTVAFLQRADQLEQEEEWTKATAYYQRYLLVHPEDTTTLVKMVETYAKGKPTPTRIARLNRLLYQAVGRAPERHDLRIMLAENLLKSGNPEAALKESAEVQEKLSGDEALPARKVEALSKYLLALNGGQTSVAEAVESLVDIVEEMPGDVQLNVTAANALRENPDAMQFAGKTSATYADEIMDRLVNAAPENVEARVARHRYRVRYQPNDAEEDLAAALKLSPDNIDVLLLAASAAGSESGEEATRLLQKAIEVAPQDPRAYLTLAKVLIEDEDRNEALKHLRQGYKNTEKNLQVGLALCGELIALGEHNEAAKTLRYLESSSIELLVQLDATGRAQLENRFKLLQAKLDLANEEFEKATSNLEALLLSSEVAQAAGQSVDWVEANRMLARLASDAGQWDRAADYWNKLAVILPRNANVCLATATAYLNAGNAASAIQSIDRFSRLSDPTADMLVLLTQSHLALQLSQPLPDRNWTEFQESLESAKAEATGHWELVFAEIDYLLSDSKSETFADNQSRASDLLKDAQSVFNTNAEFWRKAAIAYQRLDRTAASENALHRYLELESSAIAQASAQVTLLKNVGKFEDAEKLLQEMRPTLTAEEQPQIDRLRIDNLVSANDQEKAQRLVAQLIDSGVEDPQLVAMGIELSLGLGQIETAKQWEKLLSDYASHKFQHHYLRSLRQVISYDKISRSEKEELARTVVSLRAKRPRWHPVVTLSAWHALLEGKRSQAVSEYQLAVDLGNRQARTLEQLVTLLYEEDRISEAQQYFQLFDEEHTNSAGHDSLAIQLALKQDRIEEAIELAKQGVQRHPDEVMRHIWLANLQLRNQQVDQAVQVLKHASRRFPKDPKVWQGLFTLFVNTNRTEQARKTLANLLEGEVLPQQSRHFVVAQGFEILGEHEEAKRHYQQAVTSLPQKTAIRLRYAKLLLASNSSLARSQYEQVLAQEPNNGEARRELATLLATTGQEKDWQRAQELLKQSANDSLADSIANNRLRAMLLVRQGTRQQRLANCQTAREIVERLLNTSGEQDRDVNRRLMASIYEQEAQLANDRSLLFAAREQLRYLVDRENPTPQNLALYIEFLMRHATAESLSSGSTPEADTEVVFDGKQLRDVFLADAESRLGDLRRSQSGQDAKSPEALNSVDLTVQLLQAQGQEEQAANYVAEWVASQDYQEQSESTQSQLCLMTGKLYARLGQHAEAERWYRKLMGMNRRAYVMVVQSLVDQDKQKEAVKLCLDVAGEEPNPEEAIVLAQIMVSAKDDAEILPEAQAFIDRALARHSDNMDLLQAEAVMQATQGEYDRAVASFRRMIIADPENALAMNNLATLLAERPNQRSEALEYVNRAIDLVGRLPALLDTQGTIYLKMNDPSQAILSLEEAVVSGATDPRYYFHLAAAYELNGQIQEAASSLQIAREYGLEEAVLTDDDRNLIIHLDQRLADEPLLSTGAN